MESAESGPIMVLAVLGLAFVAAIFWARFRWKKLKPKLFPDSGEAETGSSEWAGQAGPAAFARILRLARDWLSAQAAPEAIRALDALATIEQTSGAGRAMEGLMERAIATADIASLLIGSGSGCAYFVIVPDRFESQATLRRHPAFERGWSAHLAALRARLAAGGAGTALTAFVFFLDPEGDSIMLLSFVDETGILVPLVLGDANAAAPAEVPDLSMEFRLAA